MLRLCTMAHLSSGNGNVMLAYYFVTASKNYVAHRYITKVIKHLSIELCSMMVCFLGPLAIA